MSEITVYADQLAEVADQVGALNLDEQDVVTLAYHRDGSIRVTVAARPDVGVTVPIDVNA